MRASIIAPLALVAGASAWDNVTYVTEVVTSSTTYCPGPTELVLDHKTYVVTEPTTVTFDCPCTITKPVVPTLAPPKYSSVPVAVPTVSVAAPEVSVPAEAAPVAPATSLVVVPAPAGPTASAPSAAPITPTSPSAPIFTGAASNVAASGMGLAGLAAIAAFFL